MTKRNLSALLSALASASVLLVVAACGGGGGGTASSSGSTGSVASTSVADAAAIAASAAAAVVVPTLVVSTYLAGSEELAAFNLLNVERNNCGYGTLTQSAQLDAAAKAHADYQIRNSVVSHNETLGRPGFTGASPADRVVAQGYLGAGGVTDEIVGLTGTSSKSNVGASGIRGLLSAPYHLRGLMGGYRELGVSVRSSSDLGTATSSVVLQIDAAYKSVAGPQLAGANDLNTYPCEGTTGVNRQLTNESPNPIIGRDLATNPLGTVVYVSVREGNTLSFSATATPTMTQVSTGENIKLLDPVSAANDPYRGCLEGCFKRHEAYIAADKPLQPNTEYRMQISGTNNSQPFTRSFVFTTGSGG